LSPTLYKRPSLSPVFAKTPATSESVAGENGSTIAEMACLQGFSGKSLLSAISELQIPVDQIVLLQPAQALANLARPRLPDALDGLQLTA